MRGKEEEHQLRENICTDSCGNTHEKNVMQREAEKNIKCKSLSKIQ
jgi:hypothetical protein